MDTGTSIPASAVLMPCHPQGSRYTDRRISAADKTDQHDQSKILRCVSAKEIQRSRSKQNRCQCVQTPMDALLNGIISQYFISIGLFMSPQILADPVKNDDGLIHRISQNSQYGCQERSIHLQMEECKYAENHDNIMADGNNRDMAIRYSNRKDT